MNKVILIGNLTRDPELQYTPNGVAVSTFTLAVNRPFSNNKGEKETDFINIVAWKNLAENCANYLSKGKKCAVVGRVQVRSYTNNEGKKVYVTEVVAESVEFLGGGQREERPYDPFAGDEPIDISDDDLPF